MKGERWATDLTWRTNQRRGCTAGYASQVQKDCSMTRDTTSGPDLQKKCAPGLRDGGDDLKYRSCTDIQLVRDLRMEGRQAAALAYSAIQRQA